MHPMINFNILIKSTTEVNGSSRKCKLVTSHTYSTYTHVNTYKYADTQADK